MPTKRPTGSRESAPFDKARRYSFLLLKYRMRSEHELAERLARKGFAPPEVSQTLAFLKEHRFVDDAAFAKAWIADRLKRPYGVRRITRELLQKGIDREVIRSAMEEATEGYSEEALVRSLASQRLSRMKTVEPDTARRRVFAFLIRRGFSPEKAIEALQDL